MTFAVRDDFSVDPYLAAVYRDGKYTCSEFARDVWLCLTGEDIAERLSLLHRAAGDRRIHASDYRGFTKMAKPESPCIALMRRPKDVPHMGIYLRRRILHLNGRGSFFQTPDAAMLGYRTLSYYR